MVTYIIILIDFLYAIVRLGPSAMAYFYDPHRSAIGLIDAGDIRRIVVFLLKDCFIAPFLRFFLFAIFIVITRRLCRYRSILQARSTVITRS